MIVNARQLGLTPRLLYYAVANWPGLFPLVPTDACLFPRHLLKSCEPKNRSGKTGVVTLSRGKNNVSAVYLSTRRKIENAKTHRSVDAMLAYAECETENLIREISMSCWRSSTHWWKAE